ncbi:Pao retrotransposon peptidase [Popillia japonica]|uniref:Pao retrotransposon peptidase n=1 Tax=Popillia japonica TaxID=7064 RepID=A0AAW1KMX7_POPJA
MQDLEVRFKNFDDVPSQIEILDGSTDQEVERSKFEDLFYMEISKAKDIINNGSGSNSSVSSHYESNTHTKFTKRIVLSVISQIYDPLGLIGPVITKAKLILQLLWQSKLNWDQSLSVELELIWSLSVELELIWSRFYKHIQSINELQIPRKLIIDNRVSIDIHVFSDASEKAYGTCLFVRSVDCFKNVCVKLGCSKSRVAPLKVLSLPRLELSAAVLSVQLCLKALMAFNLSFNSITFWCDSTIVLSWIATESSKLKTFVANRVSKIQRFSKLSQWRYVPSHENPADIISRGLNPDEIINYTSWFNGPRWLFLETDCWPITDPKIFKEKDSHETKSTFTSITTNSTELEVGFNDIISNFNHHK